MYVMLAIKDARSRQVQNPGFQSTVELLIASTEKNLKWAYRELEMGRPAKAIIKFHQALIDAQRVVELAAKS